jgi:hypothetical protein
MALATEIRNQIKQFPVGKTFGYADLRISKEDYATAAKALERFQKELLIKKLSKGIFYRPEQTIFGELKPDYNELLRPYLFKNGKRVAYITGASLYNRLGLTTQIAFRITIASRSKRIKINRETLKANGVKSYTEVTDKNYQALGLLDAFKDVKDIPDCSVKQAVRRLRAILKELTNNETVTLLEYALLYPPRVRALVGAILENIGNKDTGKLKASLNPLTKIKLGINETELPNKSDWYIE